MAINFLPAITGGGNNAEEIYFCFMLVCCLRIAITRGFCQCDDSLLSRSRPGRRRLCGQP